MRELISTSDNRYATKLRDDLRARIVRSIPRQNLDHVAREGGCEAPQRMDKVDLNYWVLNNWTRCEEDVFAYLDRAKDR